MGVAGARGAAATFSAGWEYVTGTEGHFRISLQAVKSGRFMKTIRTGDANVMRPQETAFSGQHLANSIRLFAPLALWNYMFGERQGVQVISPRSAVNLKIT